MHVIVEGMGPDVLLLHGFPDSHDVWRYQIDALKQAGYRVIAPDLRGFGQSQMLPRVADYRVAHILKDIEALLNALGVQRARVIGHDWGAAIGWQFAIHYSERVERYAALSVGHLTSYARAGWLQKLKAYYMLLIQLRGFIEWIVKLNDWALFRLFGGAPQEYPFQRRAMSAPGRLTAAMNYYRANLTLLLPRFRGYVNVPVLGIFGSTDRYLVESQMKDSGKYCTAGWRYERLEGVGHWMQSEAPEQVNELLLDFLR